MIIIRKLLPDLLIPEAGNDVNGLGIRRIYADCRRAGVEGAPLIPLFGHLSDQLFVWRGTVPLPPVPQGAQPPPPPPPPPLPPAQQVPIHHAAAVGLEDEPVEEPAAPLRRMRRQREVEEHLERQPTALREGIVEDVYGAQEQHGAAVDAQAVEEVATQVLSPRAAAAAAIGGMSFGMGSWSSFDQITWSSKTIEEIQGMIGPIGQEHVRPSQVGCT